MSYLKALSFSEEEYRDRVAAVQEEIRRRGLDAHIVSSCANICYLTGFQTIGSYGYGMYAVIVLPEGDPLPFASDFEQHNALISSWLEDWHVYPVTADAVSELARLIHAQGLARKRVGLETRHHALTAEEHDRLRQLLPDATLVDSSDLMETAMRIKSPAEIAVLRRAADLSSAGALAAIDGVCAGASDNDIAAAVYSTIVSAGGEYFALQPVVTAGKRSGIPHSTFRRNRLVEGDVVFIEIAASYERYSAPLLRTASLGKPSAEVRRAYNACIASVSTLIDQIRPGATSGDVARMAGAALRAIEPNLVWHGYFGYSVGLAFPPMCCDCPTVEITEQSSMILQTGMVFHCNTSLRNIGRFGTTVGETLLVTDDGCETLTNAPRDLSIR